MEKKLKTKWLGRTRLQSIISNVFFLVTLSRSSGKMLSWRVIFLTNKSESGNPTKATSLVISVQVVSHEQASHEGFTKTKVYFFHYIHQPTTHKWWSLSMSEEHNVWLLKNYYLILYLNYRILNIHYIKFGKCQRVWRKKTRVTYDSII